MVPLERICYYKINDDILIPHELCPKPVSPMRVCILLSWILLSSIDYNKVSSQSSLVLFLHAYNFFMERGYSQLPHYIHLFRFHKPHQHKEILVWCTGKRRLTSCLNNHLTLFELQCLYYPYNLKYCAPKYMHQDYDRNVKKKIHSCPVWCS